MAGYFTDKNKKLHQFAGGDNSTKYCLPVGTIFPSAIPLTDASVHLLDGSTISQTGAYQEFAELLKSLVSAGYNISCSQSDFDSAVSSTGNCGKFVIDNTSNTIRLPKITRFIQGLSNMIDIGKSVEAGLPNITGNSVSVRGSSTSYEPNGAFSRGNSTSWAGNTETAGTFINFDASKSNAIYGKSTTVQPQATSFPYYIVLANGFSNDVKFNIDNIMEEINEIKIKSRLGFGAQNNTGTTYTASSGKVYLKQNGTITTTGKPILVFSNVQFESVGSTTRVVVKVGDVELANDISLTSGNSTFMTVADLPAGTYNVDWYCYGLLSDSTFKFKAWCSNSLCLTEI